MIDTPKQVTDLPAKRQVALSVRPRHDSLLIAAAIFPFLPECVERMDGLRNTPAKCRTAFASGSATVPAATSMATAKAAMSAAEAAKPAAAANRRGMGHTKRAVTRRAEMIYAAPKLMAAIMARSTIDDMPVARMIARRAVEVEKPGRHRGRNWARKAVARIGRVPPCVVVGAIAGTAGQRQDGHAGADATQPASLLCSSVTSFSHLRDRRAQRHR